MREAKRSRIPPMEDLFSSWPDNRSDILHHLGRQLEKEFGFATGTLIKQLVMAFAKETDDYLQGLFKSCFRKIAEYNKGALKETLTSQLFPLLQDQNFSVALSTVDTLDYMGVNTPETLPTLMIALKTDALFEKDVSALSFVSRCFKAIAKDGHADAGSISNSLLSLLEDPNFSVACRTAHVLFSMGIETPKMSALLIQALKNSSIPRADAQILAASTTMKPVITELPILIENLKRPGLHDNDGFSSYIFSLLKSIGPAAAPELFRNFPNINKELWILAIDILQFMGMGEEQLTPLLLHGIREGTSRAKITCIEKIEKFSTLNSAVIVELHNALQNSEARVRLAAMTMLIREKAISTKEISKMAIHDPECFVCLAAMTALIEQGVVSSERAIKIVTALKIFMEDCHQGTIIGGLDTLVSLRASEAIPFINEAMAQKRECFMEVWDQEAYETMEKAVETLEVDLVRMEYDDPMVKKTWGLEEIPEVMGDLDPPL